TVEPIQTVATSQPEISIRGLCYCCNCTWRAVFRPPRCMRELSDCPITVNRASMRAGKSEEKADHYHLNNAPKMNYLPPAHYGLPFTFESPGSLLMISSPLKQSESGAA